jgi:plastocyanin
MNIRTIIFAMIVLGSITVIVNASATTYAVYVDDGYGFYKVRNLDMPPVKFEYANHVLTINQGDTIIWQNDAEKTTFTILSDQNLWNSQIGYLRVGSKFNYKFDTTGIYTMYIKEYPSIRQTIIVNAIGSHPTPTVTVTGESTVTSTVVPTNSPTNPISTTIIPTTITPIPTNVSTTITPIPTNVSTSTNSSIQTSNIKITTIASIVVAVLSIIISYRVGRNKK